MDFNYPQKIAFEGILGSSTVSLKPINQSSCYHWSGKPFYKNQIFVNSLNYIDLFFFFLIMLDIYQHLQICARFKPFLCFLRPLLKCSVFFMLSRVLWRAVTDLMPGFYCQVKLELSETIYWSRKPRGQVGVGSAESFRMGSLCTLMVGFGAPAQHPLPGAVSPGVLWMPTGAEDLQHHQTWKLCCPVWLGMVWGAPWHPQQQQKVDLGVFLETHWQGKKTDVLQHLWPKKGCC